MRKLATLALPAALAALFGQQTPSSGARTGAQIARFHSSVDGSEQPYALYVPKSFDPAARYPLVVSLHAEDSNHRINLRRLFGVANRAGQPDTEDMRYFPPVADVSYLVAAPFARGTMGYQGIAEHDVWDMMADVERRFPVDPDRVYLTGISMGGAGALWLALSRPDVWAAVAPLCPTTLPPGAEELLPNAINLPVRIFQGDEDPIVPVESARAMQRRLVDAGVAADYVEFPGVRHNAWDLAYRNGAIFEWFAKYRRDRWPARVRLRTKSYRQSSAYWLRIDSLTPGTGASVDAEWAGASALKVETREVEGFSVALKEAPAGIVTVTIDGAALRVKAAAELSFAKAAGRSGAPVWRSGRTSPPAAGKRPGLEGPIEEVVSGPQIYVYGTLGATADEVEARRKLAEAAANWSTPRWRLALAFPVKADTAVTDADLDSANLVLFGTVATNSVIARLAPRLPFALDPGAADYGLLYVFPAGKHDVLVSSGLPWWTGADDAGRGGDLFAPPQFRLLASFGDWVLFKGSLGNVVSEGRFDRNWKVPADAARQIEAAGTVTVH